MDLKLILKVWLLRVATIEHLRFQVIDKSFEIYFHYEEFKGIKSGSMLDFLQSLSQQKSTTLWPTFWDRKINFWCEIGCYFIDVSEFRHFPLWNSSKQDIYFTNIEPELKYSELRFLSK